VSCVERRFRTESLTSRMAGIVGDDDEDGALRRLVTKLCEHEEAIDGIELGRD